MSKYFRFRTFLVAFVAATMIQVLAFQSVFAAPSDLGFRWGTYAPTVTNYTSSYYYAVENARADWDWNTRLILGSGSGGSINAVEGYYNSPNWIGLGVPYVWVSWQGQWQACSNWSNGSLTGWCGYAGLQPTFAYIYFDSADGAPHPWSQWIARHEMGHLWGMGHDTYCTGWNVMRSGNCGSGPGWITSEDINWVNSRY